MFTAQETAERLLSELEEAGAENVATLLNTIFAPTGSNSELETVMLAVEQLLKSGDITLETLPRRPRQHTAAVPLNVDGLPALISYSTERKCWTFASDGVPEIVLTEKGRSRSRAILERRGYQWWRQSK
ncbi:MAG TPA: hypothetical protein PK970_12985 [Hyphomicrobiaceae bacterium]|nr:hypothetical protein [Hyphomicrobiaceae bacterium]